MIRSAEEEVGDAADSVIATLQSGECVVGRMLDEETSAIKTSGNGRRLAASHLLIVVKHTLLMMIHNICMCDICMFDNPLRRCIEDPLPESCTEENQQFYERTSTCSMTLSHMRHVALALGLGAHCH